MKNSSLFPLIFLIFSVVLSGCKAAEEQAAVPAEPVPDTGALSIESSPTLAQVYVGEEYKGDTTVDLYNLPVGQYEITVKKQGYADFRKTVNVKVGRTEKVDAVLTPIAEEPKPKAEGTSNQMEKPAEKMPQAAPVPSPQSNKINLSSFAMYYDFDNMQFTELRTEGSDLFSRKYENYMHFTILIPTKINVLNKPVNEAEKADCIFADTAVAQLFSGQTLCVRTGIGNVVAIGGTWQTMPVELEWKKFD